MTTTTSAHHHDLFSRHTSTGNEVGQGRYLNGSSGGYGNPDGGARERSRSRGGAMSTNQQQQYSNNNMPQTNGAQNPAVYQDDMDQPRMYVRALYSFRSDDPTSLSFSQGDMIRVLTQLESGWWDGIVHGQRGWFPSNYCVVVNSADHRENGVGMSPLDDSDDTEDGSSGDEGDEEDSDRDGIGSPQLPMEGTDDREIDEALFWIPQATPDGRLFYFNTRTGESRMELPLETPTSTTETGPRDRLNFSVPDQTRPPPEMMAGGYEREEPEYDDADSFTSEREGEALFISQENVDDPRQSFISEGSSSQSVRSRNSGTFPSDDRSERTLVDIGVSNPNSLHTTTTNGSMAPTHTESLSLHRFDSETTLKFSTSKPSTATFFNDSILIPATWDALIEDTRVSIERYREAINKRDRASYVRRAEDISDMLRLLIAAGSSTTDNHSGQPSIISTNKALHPHFRQFMAAFSKLVLSSHIASADFPPPDTELKCLQEAEEVLTGVFQFAEVARQQKKHILPRLKPGFVVGSSIAEGWSNNTHSDPSPNMESGAVNGNGDTWLPVDDDLMTKFDELTTQVRPALKRLEATLDTSETMNTPSSQNVLSGSITNGVTSVVDGMKKYFNMIDRIDLSPFIMPPRSPSYDDVVNQKQRLYDSFADLIMACQAVTAPLADEWTHHRGETLDERLNFIRVYVKEVENGIQTLAFAVSMLVGERDLRQPEIKKEDLRKGSTGDLENRPLGSHARTQSRQNHPRTNSSVGERGGFGLVDKNPAQSKLEKHYGIPASEPAETPWFLGCDHDHEILYGKKKEVKGGTLIALVERLTRHDILDSTFISTFLLTYQSFTTADELFNQLARRFTLQPPPNLTPAEYEVWVERKQKLIRVRVLSVLKQWMESYWMENDDEAGKDLLKRIHTFAKDIMLQHLAGTSKLMEVIDSRIRGIAPDKKMVQNLGQAPPPILPKNMKKLKFLDIDTMEFARQLTIVESRAYRKLRPTDCLNKAWSKDKSALDGSGAEPASNVRSIILHSNQLTNWVAEMILTQADVRKRVVVIKHFIAVAEKCRQLNNFSTLTSIISALGAAPIHRLKRTWDHVPTRTTAILESMKVLMGTTLNFNEYRENLHLVNPPCVPFLGVYLKDLTFVADGNPDFIKGTELINFGKRAKTAAIIREIQQYQSVPYPLQSIQELQDYILSNMQAAKDVTEMFNVSLALEPREREDEKIARLLQESGFL